MPLRAVLTTPFDDNRQSWRWDDDATGVEYQVRGTATGPDPEWLEIAERCASNLPAISFSALAYLESNTGRISPENAEVRWVDVGVGGILAHPQIEWFATLGDEYVLWSVKLQIIGPSTFSPVAWSRRNW